MKNRLYVIRANRPKEGGKGGRVAFIIVDTFVQLFQAFNHKSSDKHQEVHAIELNEGGNNIKLVNTYIPPSSSFSTGCKTSISKLLELDDCIIVGEFNALSPLWYSKLPEDTIRNNIASEIDLSCHVILNEKASTRVTDSS